MATNAIGAAVYVPPTDRLDTPAVAEQLMREALSEQEAALKLESTLLPQMQANSAATQDLASLRNQLANLRSSLGNSLLPLVGFGQTSPLSSAQRLSLMRQVNQANAQANDLLNQVALNDPAAKLSLANLANDRLEQLGLKGNGRTGSLNTSISKDVSAGASSIARMDTADVIAAVQSLVTRQQLEQSGIKQLSIAGQTSTGVMSLLHG